MAFGDLHVQGVDLFLHIQGMDTTTPAANRDTSRAAEPTLIERIVALMPPWRPTLAYGSLIGAMLCYCLLAAFAETPSEFLYFQF